jgi:bifunctional enzyme CysN/CysC
MMDAGLTVMTAFISPFRRERAMARELIGADNFVEVFVNTSLQVCEQRDVKGLYKKARSGQIPNMTGVNSPYEAPEAPEFVVDGAEMSVAQAVDLLVGGDLADGFSPAPSSGSPATPAAAPAGPAGPWH